MRLTVHEPPGFFRVEQIEKPPLGLGGKIWFTQNINNQHHLHVGIWDPENNVLKVWKSREIKPRRKRVSLGWRYHARNPLLDEELWETRISVPFLTI